MCKRQSEANSLDHSISKKLLFLIFLKNFKNYLILKLNFFNLNFLNRFLPFLKALTREKEKQKRSGAEDTPLSVRWEGGIFGSLKLNV